MAARYRLLAFIAIVTTVALSAVRPTIAAADDKVVLGGGAGITLNGGTLCTLTAIGHDTAGDLVGLTSAHCGGPGVPVAAEGQAGQLGTVAASNPGLDYLVIKFDPAKVQPSSNVNGFAINGIGPDIRQVELQSACQQSRATGRSCAQIFVNSQTLYECGNPDDEGAPLTVNDQLIGMIRGGFVPDGSPCPQIHGFVAVHPYFPPGDRPQIVSMDAILADINAKRGPGVGFAPIAG